MKTLTRFLFSIALFCIIPIILNAQRLTVTSSWLANTNAGDNFMPQGIEDMYVAPDGTVFTNIFWEEGNGNVTIIATDGTVKSHPRGTAGWGHSGGPAVAANSTYLYFAQLFNNEGGGLLDITKWPPKGKDWYGISRRLRTDPNNGPAFDGGKGGPGENPVGSFLPVFELSTPTNQNDCQIKGLYATETEVFAACPYDDKIRVYDAATMALKRSWPVTDPTKLAMDSMGMLWVAMDSETKINRYDTNGKLQPQSITLPEGSFLGAMCIDKNDRLLIGDVGQQEWVLVYTDITVNPKLSSSFGKQFGVYSGTPGAIGPLKFNQIRGIGTDSDGNIYIGNTQYYSIGPGVWIEKYTPNGKLLWRNYCMVFTDVGSADPYTDGLDIYGATEHYSVDYNKAPGKETTFVGYTANRYKYPHDVRFKMYDNAATSVRQLDGKKFVVTTGMGSGQVPFCIYRFDYPNDGEVMIPTLVIAGSDKMPNAPKGNWMWRDLNADGQMDADEYTACPAAEAYGGNGAYMDTKGNIWYTAWGPVNKFTYKGLDENGIPMYDAKPTSEPGPAPFKTGQVRRVRYYPEEDEMYLAGTTETDKNKHWKAMGPVLARYNNWSEGNRVPVWQVILPYKTGGSPEPISFDVAGDYIFVAIDERGTLNDGTKINRGRIYVYSKDTGKTIGWIEPPTSWGQVGWMDVVECISVIKRSNGEYVIIEEDDGRSKNIMYRWTPND